MSSLKQGWIPNTTCLVDILALYACISALFSTGETNPSLQLWQHAGTGPFRLGEPVRSWISAAECQVHVATGSHPVI